MKEDFQKKSIPYIDIPSEYRAWDRDGNIVDYARVRSGKNGMVAAIRYEAAKIGTDILQAGGNVVDAAVATAIAITVCEPYCSGLAGGGIMTMYDAKKKETAFVSFRETAPAHQTANLWVQDENGNIIGNSKFDGGLSVGIPGQIDGMYHVLKKYGTMDWTNVLQPSINLARDGFIVTPAMRAGIVFLYDIIKKNEELREIYLDKDGNVPELGSVIKNELNAKTLELIRDAGPDGFYSGAMAEAIVNTVQHRGGVMTLDDLKNYKCWEAEPVYGEYRGYKIFSSPSPSSGGTFIIETLNILEKLPIHQWGSLEYFHQLIEVQNMVWADRAQYSGDTRFVNVPTQGITSKEYAAEMAKRFDAKKVQDFICGNPWGYNEKTDHLNTTGFVVADKEGNMAAVTTTLENYWGSKIYLEGYGIFLNNELDDFVAGTGYANSLEPGKAPLSCMSPMVILKEDGSPFMVLSAPGGTNIYSCIAQIIVNVIDYNMDIDSAVQAARIAAKGNTILYSCEMDEKILQELQKMGHTNFNKTNAIAHPTAIIYNEDGSLSGTGEKHSFDAQYTDAAVSAF